MTLLDIDPIVLLVILGMAGTTYLTRIMGYWLTRLYTPKGRFLAAFEILPGAMILSLTAPMVFATGIAETLAALVTLGVTLKTGNALWSILAGMLAVVVLRMAFGALG